VAGTVVEPDDDEDVRVDDGSEMLSIVHWRETSSVPHHHASSEEPCDVLLIPMPSWLRSDCCQCVDSIGTLWSGVIVIGIMLVVL